MEKIEYYYMRDALERAYGELEPTYYFKSSDIFSSKNSSEVVYVSLEFLGEHKDFIDKLAEVLDRCEVPYQLDESAYPYISVFMKSTTDVEVTPRILKEIAADIVTHILHTLERILPVNYRYSETDYAIDLYGSSAGLADIIVETANTCIPNKVKLIINKINETCKEIRIVSEDEE